MRLYGSTPLTLAVILLAAFALRLACALHLGIDVRQNFQFDPSVYDLLARRLVEGRGYVSYLGQPTAYFPPGYPAVLAAAYFAFGDALVVAWVLNAVCGALTCLFVYLTGARLFGRTIAFGAAALLAVFPGDALRASLTLTEPLFGLLVSVVLYCFVRWDEPASGRGTRWFAFGLLLGAATLVRAVTLALVFVPSVVWLARDGLRPAAARTGLIVAGLLLVVLPWMARNATVFGAWVLSTDGTFAFFNAHNPIADGGQNPGMNDIRRREWPWVERLPLAEQEVALSREELRYALRWALAHPREELAAIGPRLAYLYGSDHLPLNDRPSTPNGRVAIVLADAFFFAVLVLAALGLPETLRPLGARLALPVTVLGITALHALLFFGDPRYHAPVVPSLVVLAALGIRRVSSWLRARA